MKIIIFVFIWKNYLFVYFGRGTFHVGYVIYFSSSKFPDCFSDNSQVVVSICKIQNIEQVTDRTITQYIMSWLINLFKKFNHMHRWYEYYLLHSIVMGLIACWQRFPFFFHFNNVLRSFITNVWQITLPLSQHAFKGVLLWHCGSWEPRCIQYLLYCFSPVLIYTEYNYQYDLQ